MAWRTQPIKRSFSNATKRCVVVGFAMLGLAAILIAGPAVLVPGERTQPTQWEGGRPRVPFLTNKLK